MEIDYKNGQLGQISRMLSMRLNIDDNVDNTEQMVKSLVDALYSLSSIRRDQLLIKAKCLFEKYTDL